MKKSILLLCLLAMSCCVAEKSSKPDPEVKMDLTKNNSSNFIYYRIGASSLGVAPLPSIGLGVRSQWDEYGSDFHISTSGISRNHTHIYMMNIGADCLYFWPKNLYGGLGLGGTLYLFYGLFNDVDHTFTAGKIRGLVGYKFNEKSFVQIDLDTIFDQHMTFPSYAISYGHSF